MLDYLMFTSGLLEGR